MDPVTGGLLAAGGLGLLNVFGSVLGSGISAASTAEANKMNLKIARENRAWMEQMANSAHQREVKDLRAAGLNPMLSAGLTGAATPAAATDAHQQPAKWEFGRLGSEFLQGMQIAAQIGQANATARNQDAQAFLADSATTLNHNKAITEAFESDIRAAKLKYAEDVSRIGRDKAAAEFRSAAADAKMKEADALFRVSPRGSTAYETKKNFDIFRGMNFQNLPPATSFNIFNGVSGR